MDKRFPFSRPMEDRPHTVNDVTLKKAVALQGLEHEISNEYVSESMLELLDLMEDLLALEGRDTSQALKIAQCLVAVALTVRFQSTEDDKPHFVEAYMKLWEKRTKLGNKLGNTTELTRDWKDAIGDALWKGNCCNPDLIRRITRLALKSVDIFVKETKGSSAKASEFCLQNTQFQPNLEWFEKALLTNLSDKENPSREHGLSACEDVPCSSSQDREANKGNALRRLKHVSFKRKNEDDMRSCHHKFKWNNSIEESSRSGMTGESWSLMEEESLRFGVCLYDKNWERIYDAFRKNFRGRTPDDLEEKWRTWTLKRATLFTNQKK